ncbi:sulfurtransferase TusA [Marinospirillum alkaliphilum]|uniref:tRNA 2-thiouridine synthesizing protein A n=1 Tax=Marinospirillum alkaliphilum DSM 21637 TaxID=1122209 RepID=A0A1K1UFV9_9GAMM|nr:sulfurtransferase TusA [Marinospirillum alkaliphilum]SFX11682.1 tRNA 2-thiouridine synthesizing protein A [Marinospirillum alkaliphilum DSM 21637]
MPESVAPEHQHQLDTSGLYCPEPVMLLHGKLDEVDAGEVLLVIATDPATTRDIPRFCQFLKQELLLQDENSEVYRYWIKKA